jgi:hypothetical protein
MPLEYNGTTIKATKIVNDNEVPPLRDFLKTNAPAKITFDFSECKDVHTAILQIIFAYKILHECDFVFEDGSEVAFKKALDGFRAS